MEKENKTEQEYALMAELVPKLTEAAMEFAEMTGVSAYIFGGRTLDQLTETERSAFEAFITLNFSSILIIQGVTLCKNDNFIAGVLLLEEAKAAYEMVLQTHPEIAVAVKKKIGKVGNPLEGVGL